MYLLRTASIVLGILLAASLVVNFHQYRTIVTSRHEHISRVNQVADRLVQETADNERMLNELLKDSTLSASTLNQLTDTYLDLSKQSGELFNLVKTIDSRNQTVLNNYTSNIAYLIWMYFRNEQAMIRDIRNLDENERTQINTILNVTHNWNQIIKGKTDDHPLSLEKNARVATDILTGLSEYAEKNYMDLVDKKLIFGK
ncbi:hypothetical protein [Paenibacillus sp. GP183]|uniref:hypothetical protein n=1 Tax=Paenibacillus sp. GP183 TaxID=1882751 RepID=UPI0008947E4B|nr:hypothetical protein [Paenibacillus sp. GP183]SED11418.1 hypothetical protein SAMN05443246_5767 [Paenibacillus sp. GP183]